MKQMGKPHTRSGSRKRTGSEARLPSLKAHPREPTSSSGALHLEKATTVHQHHQFFPSVQIHEPARTFHLQNTALSLLCSECLVVRFLFHSVGLRVFLQHTWTFFYFPRHIGSLTWKEKPLHHRSLLNLKLQLWLSFSMLHTCRLILCLPGLKINSTSHCF